MGGNPRFCVQCGSGLRPGTRFCGECGHAMAPAEVEAAAVTQPGAVSHEIGVPARGTGARPGLPSPRPPSEWPGAPLPADTSVDSGPAPAGDGFPPPPSFAAPPSFAPPPTGPAYPPPPAPSSPQPSPPPPPAVDSSAPLTGPAYPPTAPSYPRPPGRPTPPPPDPSYPAPAQFALPAGPSSPHPAGPSAPPPPGSGDTAQFGNSWMDEVGFNPQWERGPAALPSITDSRSGNDRTRQRGPLVIGLVVLVAAVLVVPALLIVHAMHGLGGGSPAAAGQPPASQKPTKSGPAAAPATQKAAAGALAALLAQSVTDRDTIVRAVGAVNQCTSGLAQAPQAFQNAATGRQRLLRQLAQLPGRSTLPAAMLRSLTGAWQASATVDQDLGRWAQDEASKGCHKEDHNDTNFQASNTPDVQATNDKGAFISQWNQVAAKYNLTRYSTGQL